MSSNNTNTNVFDSFQKSSGALFSKVWSSSQLEMGNDSTHSNGSNNNTNNNNNNGGSDDDSQLSNETNWANELSHYCPKLTFEERLIGFVMSFGLGYLIAFFSFRFFVKLIEGNPFPFAINYTVGHVMQLLSSMFLCGPQRQFRLMFDKNRYMTSMVYLGSLGVTVLLIFIPFGPSGLKLFLLLSLTMLQFLASTWYTLSYIPFGRRTALRLLQRVFGIEGDYSTITSVLT